MNTTPVLATPRLTRRAVSFAAVLALGAAGAAHAQAPGSVFGQQPQQLQPQFQAPAPSSPVAPFKKPSTTTPNWNAVGSNAPPVFTPPAAAPTLAPYPAAPVKTGIPARKAPALQLSRQMLTKVAPNRAALLQAQIKVRDEENRIAQTLKGRWAQQPASAGTVAPSSAAFAGQPGRTSSLAAAAAAHSPLAAHNAKTQDALAAQPDGIWSVNNQVRSFVITPGGNVVIFGKGFGRSPGQVFAKGLTGFPGGAAALQVNAWSDFEIDAVLPAGIRGVPDLDGISVQVLTASSKGFILGNGRFYAERAEIALPRSVDLHAIFDVRLSPNWRVNFNPGEGPATNVSMSADGFVDRDSESSALDCAQPGIDTLFPKDLPRGFQVSGVAMSYGRTDSGDGNGMPNDEAGNHMFIPGYSIAWGQTRVAVGRNRDKVVDSLSISWGVWRSHTSPAINRGPTDICLSNYMITDVSVIGPAGLIPF